MICYNASVKGLLHAEEGSEGGKIFSNVGDRYLYPLRKSVKSPLVKAEIRFVT